MGLSPWAGPRGVGSRSKLNFLEYDHVAYQIKADDVWSKIVANILPTDTPLIYGGVLVKPYLFVKVVILHIKLK